MNEDIIQKLINKYHYWDMRVKSINCCYFSDEVTLVYNDGEYEVVYRFVGCYKVVFEHAKNYEKFSAVRDMTIAQTPYFLQDVNVTSVFEENESFYVTKLNIHPLYAEIWSKNIEVGRNDICQEGVSIPNVLST